MWHLQVWYFQREFEGFCMHSTARIDACSPISDGCLQLSERKFRGAISIGWFEKENLFIYSIIFCLKFWRIGIKKCFQNQPKEIEKNGKQKNVKNGEKWKKNYFAKYDEIQMIHRKYSIHFRRRFRQLTRFSNISWFFWAIV